jgi:hypothetical protein
MNLKNGGLLRNVHCAWRWPRRHRLVSKKAACAGLAGLKCAECLRQICSRSSSISVIADPIPRYWRHLGLIDTPPT